MRTDLTGNVRIVGKGEASLRVEIHLEDEELRLISNQGELGRWPLSEIGVAAKLDGFHLRIEGEELIISTNDDARFALALGIRSSNSPRLNRLVAGALNDSAVVYPPAPTPGEPVVIRRPSGPTVDNTVPLTLGLAAAAASQALGGIVGWASDSTLEIFGRLPAWPIWLVAALVVAGGALSLWYGWGAGRRMVAAGAVLGLVILAGSLVGLTEPTFSWLSDGVAFGGLGTILAGLLLSIEPLDRRD